MSDLFLDYGLLVASELWLRHHDSTTYQHDQQPIQVEKTEGWNYAELQSLVRDLPMPAMIVDLDIFDANIRFEWFLHFVVVVVVGLNFDLCFSCALQEVL